MADRNALIFVDFPTPDPEATSRFYSEVFAWEAEPHPKGVFHLLRPGGELLRDDGSSSGRSNLNLGVYNVASPVPDPRPVEGIPTISGPGVRVYVVNPDRAEQNAAMDRAIERGATALWRDLYWDEFEGYHGSFLDPWGNQVILWTKPED